MAILGGLMCEFIGLTHFKLNGFCSVFVLLIVTIFLPALVLFFSIIFGGYGTFVVIEKCGLAKLFKC
jgi:hypothetical protein